MAGRRRARWTPRRWKTASNRPRVRPRRAAPLRSIRCWWGAGGKRLHGADGCSAPRPNGWRFKPSLRGLGSIRGCRWVSSSGWGPDGTRAASTPRKVGEKPGRPARSAKLGIIGQGRPMFNRITVNALLKSVLAIMAVTIIVLLSVASWQSWTRLATVNQIAAVTNAFTTMSPAMHNLGLDRAGTFRELASDRVSTEPVPQIKGARAIAMPALQQLMPALAAIDF